MLDNLPLAAPGRALSAPADRKAADRWERWWTGYFTVVYLTAFVVVALTASTPSRRLIACSALAGAAVLYAALGRRVLRGDRQSTREAAIYLVLTAALVALAQSQVGAGSWTLFATCPQVFMIASLRVAVAVVVGLNLTPGRCCSCWSPGIRTASRSP